jgi:AICAR transformylase/IMP cyclohydrolase PurH
VTGAAKGTFLSLYEGSLLVPTPTPTCTNPARHTSCRHNMQVCDGIIAPSFASSALEVLSAKKKGARTEHRPVYMRSEIFRHTQIYIILFTNSMSPTIGTFVVLRADPSYCAPDIEFREVFGVGFAQTRNKAAFTAAHLNNVVTPATAGAGAVQGAGDSQGPGPLLPQDAVRDLILASICLK